MGLWVVCEFFVCLFICSCKFRFEFQSDEKVVLLKAIISKQDSK